MAISLWPHFWPTLYIGAVLHLIQHLCILSWFVVTTVLIYCLHYKNSDRI